MEENKVSVIIPIYNLEKYIGDCLESVIKQTLANLQIICVNDGSTDDSLKIVQKYAERDNRVQIISQPNSGVSVTRNTGLANATGEFIYFFDGDDLLQENALEILSEYATSEDLDILLFDGKRFYDEEYLDSTVNPFQPIYQRKSDYKGVYKGEDLFVEMATNNDFNVNLGIQFFRRKFLIDRKLNFIEGIIHEDNTFSLQALVLAKRAGYIKEELYWRRIHSNSIMTSIVGINNYIGLHTTIVENLKFLLEYREELNDKTIEKISKIVLTIFGVIYDSFKDKSYKIPKYDDALSNLLSDIVSQPLKFYKKEKNNKDKSSALLQKSVSYRIGRVITFIPRKIRGLFIHFKNEGVVKTFKYSIYLIKQVFKKS